MSDEPASKEAFPWERSLSEVPHRRVFCSRCGQPEWQYGEPEKTDGTYPCWKCLMDEVGDK